MSIINDALKKVQQNISNKETASAVEKIFPVNADTVLPGARIPKSLFGAQPKKAEPPKTPLSIHEKTQSNSPTVASVAVISEQRKYQKLLLALCALISVTLVCMIFYLFFVFGENHNNPNPFESGEPVVRPAKAVKSTEIVLQGIMVRGEKKMALINNDMYEVGETVKGRKILSIDEDSVKVLDHHRVKTLSVKKKKQ